ncbi:hypothetical protein AYO38_01195 [bacterium SCGC AG-212-C10]|nr:hypothetical protein AYO38_01195 [bacterium SCGC AG-212-C10]
MFDSQHMREVLREFSFSSAIDVLIIAVAIFSLMRLLSGTRAVTQVRGVIAVALVVVILGRMFDLTVVNYLVAHSLPALLIGGAIIFQPDLRRALDRLGRTGLQGWLNRPRNEEVIEAVVTAAGRMSTERHGGLIVFERGTALGDIIETGVRVDAHVSPELLAGIFFPNSPLHDMAVVMREDRVVAAGCVLPLANDLPMSQRMLGTRHRAAIGITEQTDAVSLVVSEETGGISVALGGRLTPVADEDRLRAVLAWLLEPTASPASTLSGNGGVPV